MQYECNFNVNMSFLVHRNYHIKKNYKFKKVALSYYFRTVKILSFYRYRKYDRPSKMSSRSSLRPNTDSASIIRL